MLQLTSKVADVRWPSTGDRLVTGIGPGVAEVHVDVQTQAGSFGTLSEGQVVVEIVCSIGRVDPETLADGVDTRRGENGLEGLGGTSSRLVRVSGLLLDRDRRPVNSLVGKGGGGNGQAAQERGELFGEHCERLVES